MAFYFALSIALGVSYVLLSNRRADVFTVAILSSALFLFPTVSGSVLGFGSMDPLPVYDDMYISYVFFSMCLLFMAVASDFIVPGRQGGTGSSYGGNLFVYLVPIPAVMLSIYIWSNSDEYIFISKHDFINLNSEFYILFDALSVISLVALFLIGGIFSYFIMLFIAVTDLSMGNRSAIAIAGIAIVLIIWKNSRNSVFVKTKLKFIILGSCGVLVLIASKAIYSIFRSGEIAKFVGDVQESLSSILILGAEFIRSQYIFAEIVRSEYRTDGGHLLRAPLSILPIPRSTYTTPSSEFNELFQPALFPDISFGMAYNPFAEFYAAAGLPGVFIFSVTISVAIFFVNLFFIRAKSSFVVVALSVIAAYLAFYIHRNSMATTFGLVRNSLWPLLLIYLLYTSACFVANRYREK